MLILVRIRAVSLTDGGSSWADEMDAMPTARELS